MGYIVLLIVICLIIEGVFFISRKLDEDKEKRQEKDEKIIIEFKSLGKVLYILFGTMCIIAIISSVRQYIQGQTELSTIFIWVMLFGISFLLGGMFFEKVIFKNEYVLHRNRFGFYKIFLLSELEFYCCNDQWTAFKNEKKAFNVPSGVLSNYYYLYRVNNIQWIDLDNLSIEKMKADGLLDKPYIVKIINYNKIQEPKVFRVMQYIGSLFTGSFCIVFLNVTFQKEDASQIAVLIVLVVIFLIITLWLLNEATKIIKLDENSFSLSRFFIFKKYYRYKEIELIEIKTSTDSFAFNPTTGGPRRIYTIYDPNMFPLVSFTENSTNIRELYNKWKDATKSKEDKKKNKKKGSYE